MNEKKLQQYTAFACFGFALFCLLWVIFTYLMLPTAEGQSDFTLMVNDPQWIYVSFFGLASSVLGIFAVFGLYHANRESGMILFIGIVLLVLGLLLEMASLTWDAFIWPVVCADERFVSFVRDGIFIKSTRFSVFIVFLLSFLVLGSIMTALGLLKTKRYGILIPVLLIAGIILYGIGSFALIHVATVGLCAYSIAFILIGLKLWKAQ